MSQLNNKNLIDPLPFRVAPHMLEDLGLNLYSSLPRVLVEFIANAYDADAAMATVAIDFDRIKSQRTQMRNEWRCQVDSADTPDNGIMPLEDRLLPEDTVISIEDTGHGMTKDELENKFLVAGRRRRIEENETHTSRGRALMGRKGLGKLAGFGVARRIEVVTKVEGQEQAHGIRLDFDVMMAAGDTKKVKVPTFRIPNDAGLGKHGTRVTLSRLVHESVKSRDTTVRRSIGDHFVQIDQEDFVITLNGVQADPTPRKHSYAWPEPCRPTTEFVNHEISASETGRRVQFKYRFRFVEDRASLLASQRGVRVYAHNRLAAAPSLLHADTNMHGFRMTDYLDGVVYADFLDSLDRDYIATDRQDLRWDTPLLQPIHEFLGREIKEACKQYQKVRDEQKRIEVEADSFTVELIRVAHLSKREHRLAVTICARLASFHRQGVATPEYQQHARLLVGAVGKGEIFSAISRIAHKEQPQLHDLASEVIRLSHAEIDQTLSGVRTRILAIETLQRIVEHTAFKAGNNEDEIHALLAKSPWLIDATYFEFLTSDRSVATLFKMLAEHLRIGEHVSAVYNKTSVPETEPMEENRRPDLVFLLGNAPLNRLVIVELKAPNTPLLHKHLLQLRDYMRKAENFLKSRQENVIVEGRLIGTLALDKSANEIERLKQELDDRGPATKWDVCDLSQLLKRTLVVHKDFLKSHTDAIE